MSCSVFLQHQLYAPAHMCALEGCLSFDTIYGLLGRYEPSGSTQLCIHIFLNVYYVCVLYNRAQCYVITPSPGPLLGVTYGWHNCVIVCVCVWLVNQGRRVAPSAVGYRIVTGIGPNRAVEGAGERRVRRKVLESRGVTSQSIGEAGHTQGPEWGWARWQAGSSVGSCSAISWPPLCICSPVSSGGPGATPGEHEGQRLGRRGGAEEEEEKLSLPGTSVTLDYHDLQRKMGLASLLPSRSHTSMSSSHV